MRTIVHPYVPRVTGARQARHSVGRPVRSGSVAGSVRLTARGRLVIRALLVLVGGVALVLLAVAGRADDLPAASDRAVVVTEHDTLWSIAEKAAPHRPVRSTMEEIRELNDLDGSTVRVGELLRLPPADGR
jgi:hypothetical protein